MERRDFLCLFSKDTLIAKYSGVRPDSLIYILKRDDKYLQPFHFGSLAAPTSPKFIGEDRVAALLF